MKQILGLPFGALFCALILFIWGYVMWMLLPFYNEEIKSFADEGKVAAALVDAAADGHALYMLPTVGAEGETSQEALEAVRKQGPFVYAVVRPQSVEWGMSANLVNQAVGLLAASLILGILLMCAGIRNYFGRVFFIVLITLFVSLAAHIPNWNWFEFPPRYVALNILDTVIGWTLGGLVLAALVSPTKKKETEAAS